MLGKLSQCSNCGSTFSIHSDELFYCTLGCKTEHDLFRTQQIEVSQLNQVKISYLSPEELEKYRNRTKKKTEPRKERRIADWRWPQNRRKNG